jgi:ATP-dependent Clp protease adaptor protein ClpS
MTTVTPKEKIKTRTTPKERTIRIPRYNVVLLDDNDHTYEYVIEMLSKIFRHSHAVAFKMASQVDRIGRVVVYTTSKEEAELKRNQVHSYGPDFRLPRSKGSMSALIEPAD